MLAAAYRTSAPVAADSSRRRCDQDRDQQQNGAPERHG
jgi:hypothetical protein